LIRVVIKLEFEVESLEGRRRKSFSVILTMAGSKIGQGLLKGAERGNFHIPQLHLLG
jgi:hypothetical protein